MTDSATLVGVSSTRVDRISSSAWSPKHVLIRGAMRSQMPLAEDIVSISFENAKLMYPRWLKSVALMAFVLTGIGFIAGVLTPGIIAGILFPLGLTIIWSVGKLSTWKDALR